MFIAIGTASRGASGAYHSDSSRVHHRGPTHRRDGLRGEGQDESRL